MNGQPILGLVSWQKHSPQGDRSGHTHSVHSSLQHSLGTDNDYSELVQYIRNSEADMNAVEPVHKYS